MTTRWAHHLRGLRRMCAGLPDRRADARNGCGRAQKGDSKDFDREVDSRLPLLRRRLPDQFKIKDDKIKYVDGLNGPANEGRLVRQGAFRFRLYRPHAPPDQTADPPRRRARKGLNVDPDNPCDTLPRSELGRGAGCAAKGLAARDVAERVAGFGSAKCSNEEAYLFQKLIRQGFGHNNVDHCTRLCHASSVAALMENVGSAP